ncbi:YafY family transcriptional regulator [Sesbania bispinosa]|nr:YafY family transcriptional regulator [Sesbania bispinosa]
MPLKRFSLFLSAHRLASLGCSHCHRVSFHRHSISKIDEFVKRRPTRKRQKRPERRAKTSWTDEARAKTRRGTEQSAALVVAWRLLRLMEPWRISTVRDPGRRRFGQENRNAKFVYLSVVCGQEKWERGQFEIHRHDLRTVATRTGFQARRLTAIEGKGGRAWDGRYSRCHYRTG